MNDVSNNKKYTLILIIHYNKTFVNIVSQPVRHQVAGARNGANTHATRT